MRPCSTGRMGRQYQIHTYTHAFIGLTSILILVGTAISGEGFCTANSASLDSEAAKERVTNKRTKYLVEGTRCSRYKNKVHPVFGTYPGDIRMGQLARERGVRYLYMGELGRPLSPPNWEPVESTHLMS